MATDTTPRGGGGGRTAAANSRRILLSLDTLSSDARPLAVGLHWAMASLKAQWAALHVLQPSGSSGGAGTKPTLLVATPAPGDGGGALFNFLSDELQESISHLVSRTATLRHAITIGAGRGAAHQIRLPCAAVCVPLLDVDNQTSVGTLTLLCNDAARACTPRHARSVCMRGDTERASCCCAQGPRTSRAFSLRQGRSSACI